MNLFAPVVSFKYRYTEKNCLWKTVLTGKYRGKKTEFDLYIVHNLVGGKKGGNRKDVTPDVSPFWPLGGDIV